MKKILVIEDQISVRENLLELLDAEDFSVVSAENGRIGIQLAQKEIPDLIICDVMMPELDGHAVLSILRQNPLTAAIPFIFLTAKSDKTDFRQGMELGADDYLTKPFTRAELLGAIASRLEKQAIVNERYQKKLDDLRSSITLSLPHEMRTPLNGIIGFSQIMMQEIDVLDKQEIREMAEGINKSGERLLRLIQNFLLYAELEIIASDKERIQMLQSQRTSFPNKAITSLINQKAIQFNREADLQLGFQPATVKISENRLSKIVEELVDNAFKFSSEATIVSITNTSINNTFSLSFINEGRGMTAEHIAEVGAYRQFERKLYEQQGSGLGLIIAKRLAELHGGELKIQSKPDEKTTVQLILPCN